MKTRIHLILEEAEKERYRRRAQRDGKSLAAWLREAADEKFAAGEERGRLETLEELRAFFSACDGREKGHEPDWEQHRRVIEGSISSGSAEA